MYAHHEPTHHLLGVIRRVMRAGRTNRRAGEGNVAVDVNVVVTVEEPVPGTNRDPEQ
jgi:hypothetical protein